MPKNLNKGGRAKKAKFPKRNAGVSLSPEVIEKLSALPAVTCGEWSKSYLIEQLLRNYLGMPADYNWFDLHLISQGRIVE